MPSTAPLPWLRRAVNIPKPNQNRRKTARAHPTHRGARRIVVCPRPHPSEDVILTSPPRPCPAPNLNCAMGTLDKPADPSSSSMALAADDAAAAAATGVGGPPSTYKDEHEAFAAR